VYDDFTSSFESLLDKDCSFSIHHQNIQNLAVEIFKTLRGISDHEMLDDLFEINNNNLRSKGNLRIPSINTVYKIKNSLRYFGAIIWNSIPSDIRNSESLTLFKSQIKK